jgi:hypothetical protein
MVTDAEFLELRAVVDMQMRLLDLLNEAVTRLEEPGKGKPLRKRDRAAYMRAYRARRRQLLEAG